MACTCSAPSTQSESEVPATQSESDGSAFTVLVFTKTAGFRHESIPAGIRAIKSLGDEQHFRVDSSEDAAIFTDASLARYQVIVFLTPESEVPTSRHTNLIEHHWKGQQSNSARQFV